MIPRDLQEKPWKKILRERILQKMEKAEQTKQAQKGFDEPFLPPAEKKTRIEKETAKE